MSLLHQISDAPSDSKRSPGGKRGIFSSEIDPPVIQRYYPIRLIKAPTYFRKDIIIYNTCRTTISHSQISVYEEGDGVAGTSGLVTSLSVVRGQEECHRALYDWLKNAWTKIPSIQSEIGRDSTLFRV